MKERRILFGSIFALLFIGFVLCNLCTLVIDGTLNGFPRLLGLPYAEYAVFSLILSGILLFVIYRKPKQRRHIRTRF